MGMAVTMAPGLERRLRAELAGDVRFDRFTRGRYATDASHYQMMPIGVVTPRTIAEAERAIAIARAEKVTGAGTGRRNVAERADGQPLAGARLLEIPQPHHRSRRRRQALRRRARHRARRPQSPAQAPRAVVSGRHLDGLARHHRRHGRQQFLRCALVALRRDPRQCPLDRRDPQRRNEGAFRPGRPRPQGPGARRKVAPARRGPARHRSARIRRGRGALSEGAATGRGLQSRCARAQCAGPQSRTHPRRLGRHARLLDEDRAQAVAAARPARGRRLPLRALLRCDGGGPAYRQAQADRGRARRPHHDRACPRHRHVPPDHRCLRARRARCGAPRRVRRGGLGGEPRAPAPARSA